MDNKITSTLLQKEGKFIKYWREEDGAWYYYEYRIYEYQGHYYRVLDHIGKSSSCTDNLYGVVTEVEKPESPIVIAIIHGINHYGKAWIECQNQGSYAEMTLWSSNKIKELTRLAYLRGSGVNYHYVFYPL